MGKTIFFTGCSKRSRYKAPETGSRPEGVGVSVAFDANKFLGMEA